MCEEKGLEIHKDHKHEESDFLLGSSDLKQRVPRLDHNTLSLHLIDRGNGSKVLLTFHRMEDEEQVNKHAVKWDVEELIECGIIGRILGGIRKKLRQVKIITIIFFKIFK